MADMNLILNYLSALEQNNNREWYHENKAQYKAAWGAFEALVEELMLALKKTDDTILLTQAKNLTFKLNRDTRFSHDKSPYNPSFRAHISSKGKLPIPVGYYLMVKPGGQTFLGGGLFADMFREATAMVRDYLAVHGEEWDAIVTDPSFTKYFTVKGTALQKVPQGYDPDCPQARYLKNKSWYLEHFIPDAQLTSPDFLPKAIEVFTAMKPFNDFLNRALAGFQMPER